MAVTVDAVFDEIGAPARDGSEAPVYAVLPIAKDGSYLVGKDRNSCACLLIAEAGGVVRRRPPIRFGSLDVQFDVRCFVRERNRRAQEGKFTILRCRTAERETVRCFLTVCDAIVGMLGMGAGTEEIGEAIHRVAVIFEKMRRPPRRTVNGLFGELYVIACSADPAKTLAAWRVDDGACFDFVEEDVRLEVKTTMGRVRSHVFSYEQCNPPPGAVAIVASMFVERVARGLTLHALLDNIRMRVGSQGDLVVKLHEVAAASLGTDFEEAMKVAFDETRTQFSLSFYNLAEVPAIRVELPTGVSDVHFRTDLSTLSAVSLEALAARVPAFGGFVPRQLRLHRERSD